MWQSGHGSSCMRSWQNRKAQGKLDALVASFHSGSIRKRAKFYEELVPPSDCVK
jgi:hypothetical protein